jgi:flagellar FliL protein
MPYLFRALAVALLFLSLAACKKDDTSKEDLPVFVPLDMFTVNLSSVDNYLQATFELKVPNQQTAEEVRQYLPLIRNGVIMLLTSKNGEQLASADGKQKLGEELVSNLNEILGKEGLKDTVQSVNFTSFLVQ